MFTEKISHFLCRKTTVQYAYNLPGDIHNLLGANIRKHVFIIHHCCIHQVNQLKFKEKTKIHNFK